jgi:hypothetical protein
MKGELSQDQVMVNMLRRWIGMQPLYGPISETEKRDHVAGYFRGETLLRLAKPDCQLCDGCGYRQSSVESVCPCTGRQRRPWGSLKRLREQENPA